MSLAKPLEIIQGGKEPEVSAGELTWDRIEKILTRPIAFHPIFSRIGGGTVAGIFLSQAFYWTERTNDSEGWFYKTQAEWQEETDLTRYEQETARKKLVERELMEEDLRGLPARLHYRLRKSRILLAISQHSSSGNNSGSNPVCGKTTNKSASSKKPRKTTKAVRGKATVKYVGKPQTISTESTTESTQRVQQQTALSSDVVVDVDFSSSRNGNGNGNDDKDSLVEQLVAAGVSLKGNKEKPGAEVLAIEMPQVSARWLEWFPYLVKDYEKQGKSVENPGGLLASAIRGQWGAPASLLAEQNAREKAAATAEMRQRQADDEAAKARARADQERAAAAAAQRLDAEYSALDDDTRTGIDNDVRRALSMIGKDKTSDSPAWRGIMHSVLSKVLESQATMTDEERAEESENLKRRKLLSDTALQDRMIEGLANGKLEKLDEKAKAMVDELGVEVKPESNLLLTLRRRALCEMVQAEELSLQ